MLFRLSSPLLIALIIVVIACPTAAGVLVGHRVRVTRAGLREPTSIIQPALLGFVGLLLAFGLTMAVDRYEARRAAVVNEANAIGTTYLRAQTLAEPERSASLLLLQRYIDARLALSKFAPGTRNFNTAIADARTLQSALWENAGAALSSAPVDSAPRLYLDALNDLIDMDTTRVSALNNRIPGAVIALQIIGSALATTALGFYLGLLDRGGGGALLGVILVVLILLVILDLDRPKRGMVTVPATALISVRAEMESEPAFGGPVRR